jgi:dGTPase
MDNNNFYFPFDYECLERHRSVDYRTPFQKDRDRIIYTSAFRRLQSKTQVFMSGEYDFYRTRLTHSLEVAQIGRSICQYLFKTDKRLSDGYFIDSDLVEAVCLSHDLGHPPFGHAGEKALNRLMRPYGGFEGNAQTLRFLADTIYSEGQARRGMNPTRALLDGVLKYKTLYSQLDRPENHFLYNDQEYILDFIFNGRELLAPPGPEKDNIKSIECQIMDWADDTAYSLHDIVDGVNAGFLGLKNIQEWGNDNTLTDDEEKHLNHILELIHTNRIGRTFAYKIGQFIKGCHLDENDSFMNDLTNRYRYKLVIDPEIKNECRLYKRISLDLVFRSAQIYQLEYKEYQILSKLFDAYKEQYIDRGKPRLRILPFYVEAALAQEKDEMKRARLICDHLAGMTDGFAIRTFKRLFNPDFGSIVDFV